MLFFYVIKTNQTIIDIITSLYKSVRADQNNPHQNYVVFQNHASSEKHKEFSNAANVNNKTVDSSGI